MDHAVNLKDLPVRYKKSLIYLLIVYLNATLSYSLIDASIKVKCHLYCFYGVGPSVVAHVIEQKRILEERPGGSTEFTILTR